MLLTDLLSRLPGRPRTRFAPAPTGYLHLGHIVNAMYVWGLARALDGVVVLRVEDHDAERSRPEYERALLEDLEWLGFEPDEGWSRPGGRPQVTCRQSGRTAVYARALQTLDAEGLVYACTCSRRQLESRAGVTAGERRYPGTCRARGCSREGAGLRVRIEDTIEPFDDALLGRVEQRPAAQCGDVLIRDRAGQWTYQFAAAVDDTDQRIDLIVRGVDILPSTGRQKYLARLIGRATPPVFAHHPLVYARAGVKLSKSNQDTGIRDLRTAGMSAAAVLGLAAHRVALIDEPRQVTQGELPELIGSRFERSGRVG